ncbi:MAG: EamA family transporter [Phycisphaerae bacterium]|nr:EamA family transporter [Phycisphaerae bacterium]
MLLLIAAAIWGAGFTAQRAAMDSMGPFMFTGIRFAIGTLILLPLLPISSKLIQGGHPKTPMRGIYLIGALLTGLICLIGSMLQQVGLVYTDAGIAGFITGLYVMFVPILGLFIRYKVNMVTWVGATLAVIGLYFLSVYGFKSINPGDWFVLGCAVVWAIQVLMVGWLAPRIDPIQLAVVQFGFTAVLAIVIAVIIEGVDINGILAATVPLLYAGILSIGVAFTLQIIAQQKSPPAHAAILLSLEAVFAAIFGALILDETFTGLQIFGCTLMLLGIIVAQLRPPRGFIPENARSSS